METLITEIRQKMEKALDFLYKDFTKVRTGRANPALLEGVMVDYYGTPTAISQVGNISVPEPQMIVIAPWEKNMLAEISKAILRADLGMTPQNDGNIIRLPIPALTEERRKEMVKQTKKMAEEAKIALRNLRRDANDRLKRMLKAKEISEDDEKRMEAKVQEATDAFVKKIDQATSAKEAELMEV